MVFVGSTGEKVCETIFENFKAHLFLLHGPIRAIAEKQHLDSLDDFIPAFLRAENACMHAIRYAPVERHSLVSVHSLGLELMAEFHPNVRQFAILYKGLVVSSSFDPTTFAPLYSYLVSQGNSVSNTKLTEPPFGRIGTPAILPGGGSSSFGRSNAFDKDRNSHGFLLGPTGQGESVFCPIVHFPNASSGYLCVYILNGLLVALVLGDVSQFSFFKRIEKFLVDNNEINYEILSLLRNDMAAGSEGKSSKNFTYRFHNRINNSLMTDEAMEKGGRRFFGQLNNTFMYPFTKAQPTDGASKSELTATMMSLVESSPIDELAVKPSSNEGWTVFRRRNDRELLFEFNDPKMPLWKVNSEIANFIGIKFNSVYI